jgi:glycosyltransferase involved in cell wall biosynthesis
VKSLYTGFLSLRKPVYDCVRKIKPDVVFFIRPELGFLISSAKKAIEKNKREGGPDAKSVLYLHDDFAETQYPHSIKFILLNKFYIDPTINADCFVFNSEWTKNAVCKHFGPKMANAPGAVIGCPIDGTVFKRLEKPKTAEEREAFRRSYGIKNYKAMCVHVGLAEPRKNVETYYEMARLRPDVAFVRVGKLTQHYRDIINAKKLYNVFHFPEFNAPELREFYYHAELMVYPSLLEGFGLPPVEAISCGTPAVAGGTTSLLENLDGVCPLIDPPTDAEAYAKVLDRVLAGEKVVNEEKAQALLDRVSIEAYSKRVVDFLNSIV